MAEPTEPTGLTRRQVLGGLGAVLVSSTVLGFEPTHVTYVAELRESSVVGGYVIKFPDFDGKGGMYSGMYSQALTLETTKLAGAEVLKIMLGYYIEMDGISSLPQASFMTDQKELDPEKYHRVTLSIDDIMDYHRDIESRRRVIFNSS